MDPVSVEITIARPRDEVFEYLADIANHAEFNDHFMVDWRLTREDTYGYGAGARFRLKMPFNRFPWGDTTVIEFERPRRIVEAGRGGKFNRIRSLGVYDLEQGSAGTTRVRFTLLTEPKTLTDSFLESFGARGWMKRKLKKSMRRLRDILEEEPRPRRAAVARRRRAQAGHRFAASIDRIRLARVPAPRHVRCSSPSPPSPSGRAATRRRSPSTATTEGIYIDVGDLKYQVQISRAAQPHRPRGPRLPGRPARRQQLGPKDENWFAVFMRVENDSDKAAPATDGYSIKDTQGNVYKPIAMGPKNVFAYRPAVLQPKDVLPLPTARRPRTRSRARCCCSRSRSPTSRTARSSSRSRRPRARARPAPSTSTSSWSPAGAAAPRGAALIEGERRRPVAIVRVRCRYQAL